MVDDDEDDCILVQAALEEVYFGCTFLCIQDGQGVIDYLNGRGDHLDAESAPLPDLILLDLNMPRMDGRQVLERLKTDRQFRSIPVIVLTTSSDPEDVKVCYELGANSYLVKRPTFEGLVSAMNTLKEYWLDIAMLPPRNSAKAR